MKTYLSFLNYFSTTSFANTLKASSRGRKRIFVIMESEVSKFLHADSFANARKVDVSEYISD